LKPAQFVLLTDDAIVDGLRCTKLRETAKGPTRTSYWFDPHQGDALVFWELELAGSRLSSLSLRYRSEKSNEPTLTVWTPTGWTNHKEGVLDDVSQVRAIEFNKEPPAEAFQIKFPPGTAVAIDVQGSTQEAYVVAPNGTKRVIFNLNSISSPRLLRTLMQRIDFVVEPEPLRDALQFVRARYGMALAVDEASFRKAKIDLSLEVQEDTGAARLWELLTWFSAQCPGPFGIFEQNGELVLRAL
jgi:hypothetical protein